MSIQIDLLEKFLLASIPEEKLKLSCTKVFGEFKKEPIPVYASGFNEMQMYLRHEDDSYAGAAISGVMIGIFMAKLSEQPEVAKILFLDYIELIGRDKGENVVDFLNARINKRR